jgi:lipoate synthase
MTYLGFEILTYKNEIKMKNDTKKQNSTDTQMGYNTVLSAVLSDNYLHFETIDGVDGCVRKCDLENCIYQTSCPFFAKCYDKKRAVLLHG